MFTYIFQAGNYIKNLVESLDDYVDPFKKVDLVEVIETHEYVEVLRPHLPIEIIANIINQLEDPVKIAKVMQVNSIWYMEGKMRLFLDRHNTMEWLRIKRIDKLESFIISLNLNILEEYNKISNELKQRVTNITNQFKIANKEDDDAYEILNEYEENIFRPTYEEINQGPDEEDMDYIDLEENYNIYKKALYADEGYKKLLIDWREKSHIVNDLVHLRDYIVNQQGDFDEYLYQKAIGNL